MVSLSIPRLRLRREVNDGKNLLLKLIDKNIFLYYCVHYKKNNSQIIKKKHGYKTGAGVGKESIGHPNTFFMFVNCKHNTVTQKSLN